MKKIIQIFAAVLILFSSCQAYAGPDRHRKPTDPAPEFSSTVKTSFKPNTCCGGEVILVVQVLDVATKPVAAALVTASCTGQAPKYTDAKGIATFQLGTVCPCNNDPVTVTTQKGCYQKLNVSCGSYVVQCNQ